MRIQKAEIKRKSNSFFEQEKYYFHVMNQIRKKFSFCGSGKKYLDKSNFSVHYETLQIQTWI